MFTRPAHGKQVHPAIFHNFTDAGLRHDCFFDGVTFRFDENIQP
jgi:hypothetical protein